MRDKIFDAVDDLVSGLLFYDRKENKDLPLEAIESAIANGEISTDEISAFFKTRLIEGLTDSKAKVFIAQITNKL